MIFIFSDFGVTGPYSGTMRSVVMRHAPGVPVCDLMVDAPDRNPKAASYLLAALTREFNDGDVVLCVVDPGVGSSRLGIIVEADGVSFVGPDNGLFEMIIRRAKDIAIKKIDWAPNNPSASFHGRDIFAPVVARLATGHEVATSIIPTRDRFSDAQGWPDTLNEVIYIDVYGNLMTGIFALAQDEKLHLRDQVIKGARTFSDVAVGDAFHYGNSIGLCEIAVNCGRADQVFDAKIGTVVGMYGAKECNL